MSHLEVKALPLEANRLGVHLIDAFGNALGGAFLDNMQSPGQQAMPQGVGPWSDADYRNGSDIQSDNDVAERARSDALYGLGSGGSVRLGEPSGAGVALRRQVTVHVP